MHSKILLSLVLIGLVLFSGCLDGIMNTLNPPHPLGESVTVNDLKMSVNYRFEDKLYGRQSPSPGARWLTIDLTIENVGKTQRECPSSSGIHLIYAGEKIRCTASDLKLILDLGIYPGVKRTYWIAYEVPENIDLSDTVVSVNYAGSNVKWKLR